MTDEEINIAIAIHLNWKWWKFTREDGSFWTVLQKPGSESWAATPRYNGVIVAGPEGESPDSTSVPRYTADLNEMHRVERTLNINTLAQYADALDKICVPLHICPLTHWSAVAMATARQRAEAFCKAVGILKE